MPNDVIDTLQLKITNDASESVKEVDKLIKKVKALSKEVGSAPQNKATEAIKKGAEKAEREANAYLKKQAAEAKVAAAAEKAAAKAKEKAKAEEEAQIAMAKAEATAKRTAAINFFKGIGGAIGNIGKTLISPLQKAQKTLKTFISSINRIAFYRAIRTALKSVTQGFSEGIKHLYAWSEAFNTKFAPTMDQFKTQMTYLHNGFAAMFSPLIEWVVPNVIVPLTDALVELFNFIQQGFAVLVGHDYWYKAQKSMTKFADSTKKANIQLAKFDELNNLTETGSGAEEDASGMFTLEKVSTDVGNGMFAAIRQAIKDGDWYKVGAEISNGINTAIGNFNANDFASRIASKLNNAISLAMGLLKTFDWAMAGQKLGDVIQTLIAKINWSGLGYSIGKIAGGLFELIINAISRIDVPTLLNAIKNFFGGLLNGAIGGFFEDDGYLAKKFALNLSKIIIQSAHEVLAFLRGDTLPKTYKDILRNFLGIDIGKSDTLDFMRDVNYSNLIRGIDKTLAELDERHKEFLAKQQRELEQHRSAYVKIYDSMGNEVMLIGRQIGERFGSNMRTAISWAVHQVKQDITAAFANYSIKIPVSVSGGGNTHTRVTIGARGGYMPFANGGFTSNLAQGTMYVAGEVPGQAEMVGNINGRTGVASGFEITGIRDAVLSSGETEARLLQTLINALERKNLVIAPSAQLGRVVAQSNRLYGAVTG